MAAIHENLILHIVPQIVIDICCLISLKLFSLLSK